MSKKVELLKNTAILAFGKASVQVVTIFLLPIYTTYLSPEEFGFYDLVIVYITLLAPALTIQMEASVFRHLIDVRNNSYGKKIVISTVIRIVAGSIAVIAIASVLLGVLVDIPHQFLVTVMLILFAFNGVMMQVARGLGRNSVFAVGSIASAIVTLCISIVCIVGLRMGVDGVFLSMTAGYVVSIVYMVVSTRTWQFIDLRISDKCMRKSLLSYALPLIPNQAALWVVSAADKTIIALLMGVAANGIYAVAGKFSLMLVSFFGVYNMSWTESASLHINSNDKDKNTFFSDSFNTGMRIIVSASLLMISVLYLVFPLLVSEGFSQAYNYIPLLVIGAMASAAMSMYGAIYIAMKMTRRVMVTSLCAAMLSIVLALLFIPIFGLYGAALSTTFGFGFVALIRYFDTRKYVQITYDKIDYGVLAVACISVGVLYYTRSFEGSIIAAVISVIAVVFVNQKDIQAIAHKLKEWKI